MALVAAHTEKYIFQAATLEEGIKLLAYMAWQGFALPGEFISQDGVVCFNELLEEGFLGLMAFVGSVAKAIPDLRQHAGSAAVAKGSK